MNTSTPEWEKQFESGGRLFFLEDIEGVDLRNPVRLVLNDILTSERTKIREELLDRINHHFNGYGGTLGFTRSELLALTALQAGDNDKTI